jgi:glutathione S-transferase
MKLYYHPRSTYSQKVLIAAYEKQVALTPILLNPGNPEDLAELRKLTPIAKLPVLVLDNGWKIPESTIIVEYLDTHGTGPRLIPEDRDIGRQTRFYDRITDLYVTGSLRTLLVEPAKLEPAARERLDTMLGGFDAHLAGRQWIMGDTFTLADCALIPALANHLSAYPLDRLKNVSAYFERGLQRPSVARVRRELETFLAKAAS